jgi:hypothetical protein
MFFSSGKKSIEIGQIQRIQTSPDPPTSQRAQAAGERARKSEIPIKFALNIVLNGYIFFLCLVSVLGYLL